MSEDDRDLMYGRFVSLFARHERAIRGHVRVLLPSANDVDDVMQETGLVCWKKFASFTESNSPEDFVRWACVVAKFEVLRHRRNYARDRLVLSEDIIELLADDTESRLGQAERERQAVETCLQKMRPAERRLLLSVHTPGDSIAQIAEEVGQQVRRLYSKVNALRDLLANCVKGQLLDSEASYE